MTLTNAQKLEAIERWIGTNKVGVYSGIETVDWSISDFITMRDRYLKLGVDYAAIKFGEWIEWYDTRVDAIGKVFQDKGIQVVPYWFCRPQNVLNDIRYCVMLAKKYKGVMLDCEEQFRGYSAQLKQLIDGIAAQVPDAVIIVTGYGDPVYAFGWSWDFSSIENAHGYQPQWYIGAWTPYYQNGWQYAIEWGDKQCAQAFEHFGLTDMYPIQPAINTRGVKLSDLQPLAKYLMSFKDGVMVWEYQESTDDQLKEIIIGAKGTSVPPVIVPSPTPPPPPVVVPPSPQPTPSPDPLIHIVKTGEYLSEIAAEESHRLGYAISWPEIYNLNRAIIGPNPNVIKEGQRLVLPHPSHGTPPTPQPAGQREYIVGKHPWDVYGLSVIAEHLGIANWNTGLYLPNKAVIGNDPNLIKPGQVLHY